MKYKLLKEIKMNTMLDFWKKIAPWLEFEYPIIQMNTTMEVAVAQNLFHIIWEDKNYFELLNK